MAEMIRLIQDDHETLRCGFVELAELRDDRRELPTQILAYLKNRPQPKKQPCSKSISEAPQVGSADEESPPVGRPGSAAATPVPVRIIPPSTAVAARERMMTRRMVFPQVELLVNRGRRAPLPQQRRRRVSRAS